jgi:hypothetical protein
VALLPYLPEPHFVYHSQDSKVSHQVGVEQEPGELCRGNEGKKNLSGAKGELISEGN